MNQWQNLINNIRDISRFRDPDTGQPAFGNYIKQLSTRDNIKSSTTGTINKGLCYGLVHMWVQAVLYMQTGIFYDRLRILTTNPERGWPVERNKFSNLAEAIYHIRKIAQKNITVSDYFYMYLEVLALLDGILLYQEPYNTKYLTNITRQDAVRTSSYTLPESILNREKDKLPDPIIQIYNQTWITTQEELALILKSILDYILDRLSEIPFAITISTDDHIIGVKITANRLTVFDQNYLDQNLFFQHYWCPSETREETLSRLIFQRFPWKKTQNLALNIDVYISSANSRILYQDAISITINRLEKLVNSHWGRFLDIPRHTSRTEYTLDLIKNRISSYPEMVTFIEEELSILSREKPANMRFTHYMGNRPPQNISVGKYYKILIEFHNYIHNCISDFNKYYKNLYKRMLNFCLTGEPDYQQLIQHAAREGNFNTVSELLEQKMNPDITGLQTTPFHVAAKYAQTHILHLLREYKANINVRNEKDETPLHNTATKGHAHIINILLLYGANINTRDLKNKTPLHNAAKNGNPHTVTILLERGADIHACDYQLRMPVHLAAEYGNIEVLILLLRRGADPAAKTKDGRTALHLAAKNGHINIASILLASNVNINQPDVRFNYPLHYAAKNGHADTSLFLLKNSADPNLINQYHETPLSLALKKKHTYTVKVLKPHTKE